MLPSTSLHWTLLGRALGFSRPTLLAFATVWPGHLGQVVSSTWHSVVALWESCADSTAQVIEIGYSAISLGNFMVNSSNLPPSTPKKSKHKKSIGLFPTRKSCFLLWIEVHTQDLHWSNRIKSFLKSITLGFLGSVPITQIHFQASFKLFILHL